MANPWEARTIHINVGGGDSAFHLLLKTENNITFVESLVVADGGTGPNVDSIVALFSKLDSLGFKRVNGGALAGFDAYLITHWDSDHYEGIYNLLFTGVWVTLDNWVDNNPNGSEAQFQEAIEKGVIRCPFTQYVWKELADGKTIRYPVTRFYGPDPCYSKFEIKESTSKGMYTWFLSSDGLIWFGIEIHFQNGSVLIAFVRLALAGEQGADLLGVDLFSGRRPTYNGGSMNQHTFMTSPRLISQVLHTEDVNRPAMICIGANGQFCDPTNEPTRNNMFWACKTNLQPIALRPQISGEWHQVPFVESQFQQVSPNVIMNETTAVNDNSVACMIIWPDPQQAIISHFFGGDLGWRQEERILRWAAVPEDENITNSPRSCPPIQFVKLSHHGSKASTPLLMLFAWNPRTVVCSNGTHLGHNIISKPSHAFECKTNVYRLGDDVIYFHVEQVAS